MANCPKCGEKLKLFELSPYCSSCGTHIMFANFEPQFQKDRRISEMSIGHFRVTLAKVKAAFLSGKWQKLKIAACFLPLAAVMLPFGSAQFTSSVYSGKITFWALDLFYNGFLGGKYAKLGSIAGGALFAEVPSALTKAMLCYLVASVAAVIILLAELLCFTGNKKSGTAAIIASAAGFGSVLASGLILSGAKCEYGPFSLTVNPLWAAAAALFLITGFVFFMGLKNPPSFVCAEEDRLRNEYYQKYKSGKIELMDVPAPIAMSEEDKKRHEKLVREAYHMDDSGEEKKDE